MEKYNKKIINNEFQLNFTEFGKCNYNNKLYNNLNSIKYKLFYYSISLIKKKKKKIFF